MSSVESPASSQLLFVGQQCSDKTCHLVDFLPLKCQHCAQPFCGEHFLPQNHSCEKYDVTKFDRVAPQCPLCNTPIAIPPGEDPNIKVSRHLETSCSSTTGRSSRTTSSTPRCQNLKCKKVLFAPIRCDSCRHQFCAEHRFPNGHNCSSLKSSPAAPSKSTPSTTSAKSTSGPSAQASIAAFKRTLASAKPAAKAAPASSSVVSKTPQSEKAPSKSQTPAPFSKTDRLLSSPLPISTTTQSASTINESITDTKHEPPKSCKSAESPINLNSWRPPPLFGTA
ncbi:hypothetical protein SISSUDRAFT_1054944 [Sistotremastrum suecicum HHB10207 ss-3]|uniref:AN1-type domain-containing protein n=1 Tax=Sistotremastrum suecicum HHB10207 ss-3 TaxID=1314776 RepID=A0A165Y579_9AGAM|nr:hypothetical protein SISSUDRAFT_1054944 [Sistotremastrum suecicum HHB10207 ss-3]